LVGNEIFKGCTDIDY